MLVPELPDPPHLMVARASWLSGPELPQGAPLAQDTGNVLLEGQIASRVEHGIVKRVEPSGRPYGGHGNTEVCFYPF